MSTYTPETLRESAMKVALGTPRHAEDLLAHADAWQALIKQIEGLTAGGSEYVNNPSRCLEEVQQRLKIAGKVAAERNDFRQRLEAAEARETELVEALKSCLWRMEQYGYSAMQSTIERARAAIKGAK